MDLMEAMRQRHSVRRYENRPLDEETARTLEELVAAVNAESGLHIQLVKDEPKAFASAMARYGHFSGVTNYFALIGKKGAALEEQCGYYGEKLVLEAQRLGLNTCWVALTFKKTPEAYEIAPGEKLSVVISLGYGATQGVPHRSKSPEALGSVDGVPDWFRAGVEAAALAPTAMNQQKFRFDYENGRVIARPGSGFYTKMDLGIAKYHFELGSGKGRELWQA
ncbi:MAG: nitroreductase [Clostridia bacterium]|nr:nitroreductase [Clostridia bacterium]